MQKVANHPLLRVLKNIWIEAIIVVNISVSLLLGNAAPFEAKLKVW